MSEQLLLAIIGFIVIGHALFLCVCLTAIRPYRSFSNTLLAAYLLALAIRISKSIVTIVFPEAPDVYTAIGLAGLYAIGPWLFLYLKSTVKERLDLSNYLHLLPAFMLLLVSPWIKEPWLYNTYILGTAQFGIYLFLFWMARKSILIANGLPKSFQAWTKKLMQGTMAIFLLFVVQILFDVRTSYIMATTVALVVLYLLTFQAFKHSKLFSGRKQHNNSGELDSITMIIERLFMDQKIYRDPALTIGKIGAEIGIKPYLVSQAINSGFKKTLPELINEYRLEEVCKKLSSRKLSHLSIEAIASDAGYHSLSPFYTSFKKTYSMTPAEYRRRSSEVGIID